MTDKTVSFAETEAAEAAEAAFDFADLAPEVLFPTAMGCHIVNPVSRKATGGVIYMYAKESKRVQDYLTGEANAQIAKQAEHAARGKDPEPTTVEKGIARSIELLTVATSHWEGINFEGAKDVKFTPAVAKKLYAIPTVREQLNKFFNETDNFTNG